MTIFDEIKQQGELIVKDMDDFVARCQTADEADFMSLNVWMTSLQSKVNHQLKLIQSVVFRLTPERRDVILAQLKTIATKSEEMQKAHWDLLIRFYGEDAAAMVISLANMIANPEKA